MAQKLTKEQVFQGIEKARAAGKSDAWIWEYLQVTDKTDFVKNARGAGKTDDWMKQYLGLTAQPTTTPVNTPATAALPQKPTAFEKALQKAKEFDQQKTTSPQAGGQSPWWQPPESASVQNPPATAELRALPGQAENVKGFLDAKGNFISLNQYDRAIDYRKQIENLRNTPTGDMRLQAFAQGVLPIAPKEQLPPGLEKAFPISYYGGKLAGLVGSMALTGGMTEAVKASPYANLLSWQVQNSPQALNMIANSARMASTFGTKELADQAARVFSGEEPTAKNLVGKPLKEAGWGVLSGATLGLENTIPRLAATAGASAAYDSLVKLADKGKIEKSDISDIILMAGVRTAIRAIGSQALTEKYKTSGMEEHLNNRLWARLMRGRADTPEANFEVQKDAALLGLPQELSQRAGFGGATKLSPGHGIYPLQDISVGEKLFGAGIQQQEVSGINQNMDDLGKSAYSMVVKQKFPGFEGMPTEMKERIIGSVIESAKKGVPIDQAIDQASEIVRPYTDKLLESLSGIRPDIPKEKTTIRHDTGQVPTLWEKTIGTMEKPQFEGILTAKVPGFETWPDEAKNKAFNNLVNELAGGKTVDEAVNYAATVSKPLTEQERFQELMIPGGGLASEKQFEQVIPPSWKGTSLAEPKDQKDPKQLAREIERATTPLPTPDRGRYIRETLAASESVKPPSSLDEKEVMRQEIIRQQKQKEAKALEGKKRTPGFLQTAEQKLGKGLRERIEEPTPDFLKTAEEKLRDKVLQDKELRKEVSKELRRKLKPATEKSVTQEIEKRIDQAKTGKALMKKLGLTSGKPETTKIEDWVKGKGSQDASLISKEEMPKSTIFTAEGEKQPLYPEGTSNKVQRKVAHEWAKQAGMMDPEYRQLARKVTGISSTTNMSEEQAGTFLSGIDKRIRQKEDITLSSVFVSRERRMKVLDARQERARQIGKAVIPEEIQKETGNLKTKFEAAAMDPEKMEKMPKEILHDHREATVYANWRAIRFEFRRDKNAYDLSKRIADASVAKTEFVLNAKKEARGAAKGLTEQDLIDIRRFREGLSNAPARLTPGQAKFNDFLQTGFDKFHQVFGVKGYIKDYISRMTSAEILSMEEKLIQRLYGEVNEAGILVAGKAKIPAHINEWFKKERLRIQSKEGMEENALTIFEKYVNTGAKALYFQDIIDEAKKLFPRFEKYPKMKSLLERYLFRMLGYPDENESALAATLRDAHGYLTEFPVVSKITNQPKIRSKVDKLLDESAPYDIARFLIDTTYMRTMGLRPQMFPRQMLQTLNNTVPMLGHSWSSAGLMDVLFNHGIRKAKKDGILKEFAPEMYKEFGQDVTKWDKTRNGVLFFHSMGDLINRGIAYSGANIKFNHYLNKIKGPMNIKQFLHNIEADKLNKRIREDMTEALKKGEIDKARFIFAKEITTLTHYDYTKEQAPLASRSFSGKLATQFLSWPLNYAEMYREAIDTEHGINYKFFARQAIMYATIAALASKMSKRTKRFVMRAMGGGPFTFGVGLNAIPPSLDPEAKSGWMVIQYIQAVLQEPFNPGTVKKWAKRYEKNLYTLKQYEPLIFKDIERWLK